jgi:RimJ/RimL family protein N-acetyltransferase
MDVAVRPAQFDDINWLVRELGRFDQFFGGKRPLLEDEDYARGVLIQMIEKHFMLIAEREDAGPIGFIGGIVTPHLFNPNIRVLGELFWWVQPEYRGTRAGLMLLNEFTAWGKANVDWLTIALEDHSPVSDRSILKRGFKPKEKSYLLEVS